MNTSTHEQILVPNGKDVYFHHVTDPGSLVSSHWHQSLEIIYVTEGELSVTVNGHTYPVRKEESIVINSSAVHSTQCQTPTGVFLIQAPYPFLKKYLPDIDHLQFTLCPQESSSSGPEYGKACSILSQMNELDLEKDGNQLRFTSLLFRFLTLLYDSFCTVYSQESVPSVILDPARMMPILKYTKEHYREPITIKEISAIAALQPEYFCRFFKKNMGQTYLEYLNELRLSHIYHDLLYTKEPLCRLLEIHGFTNYKLFRRMFRQRFSCTPMDIRRKLPDRKSTISASF